MSAFTGPLAVEFVGPDMRLASLLEQLIWEAGELGSGRLVTIPAGHVADGITVPRPLWWLIPPHGHPASRAARLHDYLLDRISAGNPHPHAPTRADADREFHLALRATGIGRALAFCLWLAVRTRTLLPVWQTNAS